MARRPHRLESAAVPRLSSIFRNPFSFLFARPSVEQRVAAYVLREHDRGRKLRDILEDPFVRNRLAPNDRLRLLDRPEIVGAIGDEAIEQARAELARV
jgi:hypothetical protein